jgi:hypothetical protein
MCFSGSEPQKFKLGDDNLELGRRAVVIHQITHHSQHKANLAYGKPQNRRRMVRDMTVIKPVLLSALNT